MAHDLSPESLSDLIATIYDCALDPSRWEQTLGRLTEVFHTQTALLGLIDHRRQWGVISKVVGIESHWLEQLQLKHGAEIQALTAKRLTSMTSLDEPQVISRDIPSDEAKASPYIQECLKPQGLVDILQYVLIHSPSRLGVFSVARHERHGLITERELAIGALLLPHIRRAVTISNVIDARIIELARMTEALDAVRCAVILTDGRGIILHANRPATDMLHDGRYIHGRGGILHAKPAAAAEELRMALRFAAEDEASIGSTGLAICLSEPHAPPVFAHVLPMTGGELRTRLEPSAVVAVFIGTQPDAEDSAELTASAYKLTPAETRVLASLLAGRTQAETAATLGISATTVKTHLESIYSKTGVSRQADLMRLAMGIARPTSTSDSSPRARPV